MNRYSKIAISGLHLIILLFITTNSYSQELSSEQFVENFGKPVIDYEQIIYAVLFLVILVVVGLFLVKKSNFSNPNNTGLIDIVYNYAINSRDKLLIAKIGKEYLLLGVSNTGIRKLHVLDNDYIHKITSEKNIKSNDFANVLMNIVGKHRNA